MIIRVQSTGNPVLRVCAQNTASAASKYDSEIQGLPSILYLPIGSCVMLLTNLCCEDDLSNGCTGTVKDFMFDDIEIQNHDSYLPLVVWVEIDDNIYSGPTYFPDNNDCRNWVPIGAKTSYVTNI